ncbi:aldehyde dehydrogenase [Alcaligenes faecalis]|uniref:aldehyde dehydrogenase n=1 Tax=Alcaligenes TaxID=507 RepID=UPI00203B83BF|nr:aldehyde dehydrogenase [Alcaligenes faecalis]MCM2557665.1 aldehyde dehydrogenase [Alcaligenes faecalis]MCM2620081.1 aldehyde dehydrogenase [Alcaligenes faecalis]MDK7586553.1 aldehyde dehydrogenase [Alcaligenes phenolicus]
MPTQQETVFELARAGKLHASHLIPGYQTTASALLDNVSPIDLAVIGKIAAGQASDVEAAVAAARTSFESGEWSELSPADRKKIMLKWVALLEQNAEELAALDCVDAGKPITECLNTDMPATIDTFSWYAETADKCFGRISPTGSDALGLITKEPIGVVAAVLPWNFPAQMYAWKVAPALVCGNSVIVKPSELTSLSAYRMTQLAHQAGVPAGALILITGTGEEVGEPLGRHGDVDIVSFTGSTEVGRLFLKYSAESNLKEVVLECGGKSPQVVFEDALLDEAVPSILAAAFWNMSENCSCGSRLIVHSSLKDTLLQKLKQGLSSWKVGLPTDPDVSIGPMVEQAHFEKVASFLQNPGKNAKLVHGGRIRSDLGSGWYIEPTIFDHITPEDRLFQEEVFGPVLAITTFETEEQAIALANDTQYGLAASLYTLDVRRAQRVSRKIKAGTVSVNGFSEGDITAPFGGFKLSGFGGKDKGMEALDQYQQTKAIWYVNQ